MFRRNKADPLVERTALKKCALNQRAGFGCGRSRALSNSAKFFINAMMDVLIVRFSVCSKESVG